MCQNVYLLVFNDLISGLKNWGVLHLDAFSHFQDFLQQLCAIPDINGQVSVDQLTTNS